MCLILFAAGAHPDYPLIVAANRDEAYVRPAAAADYWTDAPQVYGGRDLVAGGTWLAIHMDGRFAAITNYRQPDPQPNSARSRGELTRGYLLGSGDAASYMNAIRSRANEYHGFSLIAGEIDQLQFYSNRHTAPMPVQRGVHGLSNHLLDEPWPKVLSGTAVLGDLLTAGENELVRRLFDVLSNRTPAPDHLLPTTGIAFERERDLSAAFIAGETYGTRASTVLLVDAEGGALFCEREFGPAGIQLGASSRRLPMRSLTSGHRPAGRT